MCLMKIHKKRQSVKKKFINASKAPQIAKTTTSELPDEEPLSDNEEPIEE